MSRLDTHSRVEKNLMAEQMTTVQTAYGDIPLEKLVHVYEQQKEYAAKHYEKRVAYLQTEEGKLWNRARSKAYYEAHKEERRAKARARYVPKKPRKSVEVQPAPDQQK